jgi:hypothetical protein
VIVPPGFWLALGIGVVLLVCLPLMLWLDSRRK